MGDIHLNRFAEFLMRQVRDMSIDHMEMIVTGQMKGATGRALHQKVLQSGVDVALLQEFIWKTVDVTIHEFLFGLEEEQTLDLSVKLDGESKSIKEISDGLPGELYTEDGWIERYSQKPYMDYLKDM